MRYLVDGHNLVPKLPGLSLSSPDDEERLVEWLLVFCRRRRSAAEVFFDNAPLNTRKGQGPVIAHFVRAGVTADEAIRQKLIRLGKNARNWTVVSSDRQVQSEAHSRQARVLSSEDFARQMVAALSEEPGRERPGPPSKQEIEEWLEIFDKQYKTDKSE